MHNFTSFAFVVGLVLIIAIFFRDNLPAKVDLEWLKQGGGFIKIEACAGRPLQCRREAGLLAFACRRHRGLVSGFLLLFPFYGTNIAEMQIAQVVHAIVAVLFIALILGHIYIGTLGMEGAFEAMGTGEVDLNWAKEHHDLWLARKLARRGARPGRAFGNTRGMNVDCRQRCSPATLYQRITATSCPRGICARIRIPQE